MSRLLVIGCHYHYIIAYALKCFDYPLVLFLSWWSALRLRSSLWTIIHTLYDANNCYTKYLVTRVLTKELKYCSLGSTKFCGFTGRSDARGAVRELPVAILYINQAITRDDTKVNTYLAMLHKIYRQMILRIKISLRRSKKKQGLVSNHVHIWIHWIFDIDKFNSFIEECLLIFHTTKGVEYLKW